MMLKRNLETCREKDSWNIWVAIPNNGPIQTLKCSHNTCFGYSRDFIELTDVSEWIEHSKAMIRFVQ